MDEPDYATILVLDAVGMWCAADGDEATGSSVGWDDESEVVSVRIAARLTAGDVLAARVHRLTVRLVAERRPPLPSQAGRAVFLCQSW